MSEGGRGGSWSWFEKHPKGEGELGPFLGLDTQGGECHEGQVDELSGPRHPIPTEGQEGRRGQDPCRVGYGGARSAK